MADWERIAVNLWIGELKLYSFLFLSHLSFVCCICIESPVWAGMCPMCSVGLAELVQSSVKWHFRNSRRAVVHWNVASPLWGAAESPQSCPVPQAELGWACSGLSALPSATAPRLSWEGHGLSPGWLCLSAALHPNPAPVLQPFLSSGVGTAQPLSNHSENQLNLVTKKITLVWNRSFPHALLQCLSSWLSWPVVKCVKEPNPTLEGWPFLYETSNFIPRVRAVFL